ncbi:hypothetical protein BH10PLA2_BH10PLA2_27600 [soil metagenome]
MTTRGMQQALTWARATVLDREAATMTDAQLLNAFLTSRAEAAFEAILRRHGPMIFGVCKRFLPNQHDAEDAFQAVFIVFARRAGSIRPQSQLANWLYGVALKTAKKTRAYLGKKRQRERSVAVVPDIAEPHNETWTEFWSLLDQELAGLPSIYRGPIILCDLEGKSRRQAAHALGILEGTLSGRLARARKQLAARLRRRGMSLSGAALAAALVGGGASAALPPELAATTTSSIFALTGTTAVAGVALGITSISQGVIRSMIIAKVWQSSALLAVALVVTGGGIGVLTGKGHHSVQVAASELQTGNQATDKRKVFLDQVQEELKQIQQAKSRLVREKTVKQVESAQGVVQAKRIEWESRRREYLAGRGTVDFLIQSSIQLLDSELKLADEGLLDRLTIFNAQRVRLFEAYMLNLKRQAAGKLVTQDLQMVSDAYEKSRKAFEEQAKNLDATTTTNDRSKEQIATLQSALLEAAKSEWESRRLEFEAGRGTQAFLFAASRRLKDAHLKNARAAEDRLAAFRAHAERLKHIEAIVDQRFEAGKVATTEQQEARYHRIEAELELAQLLQQVSY